MQTSNRLLDDLAKVANGAASTLNGMKGEMEALVRQRIERVMADADMVPRDEFEAVKAMAAEARKQNEALEARIQTLESQLAGGAKTTKKPARKTAAKPGSATARTKKT